MGKKLLALCLLLTLLLTACSPSKPNEKLEVGDGQSIDLHSVVIQGKELTAVFTDFAGITDYALVGGQLEYVQNEILWETEFDGLHRVKQATDFNIWYDQLAKTNEKLRSASNNLPDYFAAVEGDNIRLDTYDHFAAYRSASAGKYDLMVSTPSGATHVVLSGAEELILLGWHKNRELVLAASLPGLDPNIYLMDLEPESVELNDIHVNTFSPGPHAFLPLLLNLDPVKIWQYDHEQFAYQSGGKVYAYSLTTGSRQKLANVGNANVIWGAHDLFITILDEHNDTTLWHQGQNKAVSGKLHFVPDWVNNKLYYLSLSEEQNAIYVTDLNSLLEAELARAKPGAIITCFALSPNNQRLMYIEGSKPTYDPNEEVDESVYIIDLATDTKQEIVNVSKETWMRHEQAVWIRDDLVALGHRRLWAPEDAQTLSFYTLSSNQLKPKRATELNSGLFTPDGKGVFLNDRDHSDGYGPSFKANIWYYDIVQDRLQQLTQKAEWQIQQDRALAYSPTHQLLFISRFKGYTKPSDYAGQLEHGVLVDKQGREYTLLKLRDDPIQHAIWIGNRLLIQTTDSVLIYDLVGK